jgi:tyrosyl-tRNA synthetase
MVGRDLQRDAGQEPQVCVTLPILRGTDGTRRMGKSLGNYIGVGEPALEQFGKTMSIPDDLLREWFELLTDRSAEEIGALTDPAKTHPMTAKETLGKDIVAFYYGDSEADAAAAEWRKRFSLRQDPTDIREQALLSTELDDGKVWICKLLVSLGLATSNKDARRLVEGGGVTLGPEKFKVTDHAAKVPVLDGLIVRVGSKKVVRVRLA